MWIQILIVLILALLTTVNCYYLSYFKSRAKRNIKIEENDNYYKLDAKIEFQKYLLLGIISVATFFGINEFNDLNIKADKVEKLEASIVNINKLSAEAENRYNELQKRYAGFTEKIVTDEKELLRMDFKIKEATRQLPEANIIAISKLLAQTYLAILLEHGPTADHVPYSNEYIEKESEKIIRLLIAAGLTNSEAQEYYKEIRKSTPKIEN
jgi:hypothetical protein